MLMKHSSWTKFSHRIAGTGAAAFFGFLVFSVGWQAQAQDRLLKEYIYLDGRLLAIERSPSPATVQRLAGIQSQDLKDNVAAGRPVEGDRLRLPQKACNPNTPNRQQLSASVQRGLTDDSITADADASVAVISREGWTAALETREERCMKSDLKCRENGGFDNGD
jgi:hypothetical protein